MSVFIIDTLYTRTLCNKPGYNILLALHLSWDILFNFCKSGSIIVRSISIESKYTEPVTWIELIITLLPNSQTSA